MRQPKAHKPPKGHQPPAHPKPPQHKSGGGSGKGAAAAKKPQTTVAKRKQQVSKATQHARHAAAVKAAKTRAANAKAAKAKKARGLSLGSAVACCAAEAVAQSSQIAVAPSDVLDLYRHTADSPDAGASILATFEAAYRWGLAGVRPGSFGPVDPEDPAAVILGLELPGPHAVTVAPDGCWVSWGQHYCPCQFPGAVIEEAWTVTW